MIDLRLLYHSRQIHIAFHLRTISHCERQLDYPLVGGRIGSGQRAGKGLHRGRQRHFRKGGLYRRAAVHRGRGLGRQVLDTFPVLEGRCPRSLRTDRS